VPHAFKPLSGQAEVLVIEHRGATVTTYSNEATDTRPVGATVALGLTPLIAMVTSGGAVYFSLLWSEAPEVTVWTVLFAVGFVAIAIAGIIAAIALSRGSERGRRGVIAYAAFGILFTLAKLVWWQETEAIVFGVLDVALLLLVSARRVRDWTADHGRK
jgi:hypothetical protein